ncbi:XRE family transcriptional regulator [Micromonospora tulbaghiae]|uniref:XRE family transcriptional regulator n=1 Tax=Micromonospora tulbaghiae TaxID=479978 RepID=UPI0033D50981
MNAGEFVGALRALRLWSGLSYRELAAKAQALGGSLPPSTITSMLGRNTLPRAPLIATFVLACGLDQDTADRWTAVRNSIAVGSEHPVLRSPEQLEPPSDSGTEQTPANPQVTRRRQLRLMVLGLAAFGLVISVAASLLFKPTGSQHEGAVAEPQLPSGLLAEGWFLIQPAHIPDHGFCIGEGRERNRRTDRPLAVQRSCAAIVPATYLAATSIGGVYEIRWHHPVEGVGCLTVDEALTEDETLVAPTECTGAAHQRYQLEPTQTPSSTGYRIRPTHSGLCLGILGGLADVDNGAEVAQTACTGALDQVFLLQPTTRSRLHPGQPGRREPHE